MNKDEDKDFENRFGEFIDRSSDCDSPYQFIQNQANSYSCPDRDIRYAWLKKNGYSARDMDDVNVYISKVATKHKEKFNWLFGELMKRRPDDFCGSVRLVCWGCGCGLELPALYEQSLKKEIHEFWMSVKKITLIDRSESHLLRAESIARVLFPDAEIKIYQIDLINDAIPPLSESVSCISPTIHLLPNLIDLFRNEGERHQVYGKIRKSLGRYTLLVAFSPDYGITRSALEEFKSFLGDDPKLSIKELFELDNDKPEHLLYFAIEIVSNRLKEKLTCLGNTVLGKAVLRELRRTGRTSDEFLLRVVENLSKYYDNFFSLPVTVAGAGWYAFLPRDGQPKNRLLVVCSNKIDDCDRIFKKICKWVDLRDGRKITEVAYYDCKDPSQEYLKVLKHKKINGQWEIKIESWSRPQCIQNQNMVIDWHSHFVVDNDVEVNFPERDYLDKYQKQVLAGRMKERLIRGSPGTGKSIVMLWHAIDLIRSTHRPVLILSKNNTAIANNFRRLAKGVGSPLIMNEYFSIQTVNQFLCEQANFCAHLTEHDVEKSQNDNYCDTCNKRTLSNLHVDENYVAVLIDEVQNIPYDYLDALKKAFRLKNPRTQFWLFGDEQQLTRDYGRREVDNKTVLNVPVARNCWITLKKSHRFRQAPEIKKIFDAFQLQFLQKYDVNELHMETFEETSNYFPSFAPIRYKKLSWEDLESRLKEMVSQKIHTSDKVFLICAEKEKLLKINHFLKKLKIDFQTTHDEQDEQAAKRKFTENNVKISTTTVASSQGLNIENLIFILSGNPTPETVSIAITRASSSLHVLDLEHKSEYSDFFMKYCYVE